MFIEEKFLSLRKELFCYMVSDKSISLICIMIKEMLLLSFNDKAMVFIEKSFPKRFPAVPLQEKQEP